MTSLASAVKKNPIEKTARRKAAVRPQMRNRTDCLSATLGGFKEKKIYKWFEATPVGKFRPELGWIPCNPDKIIYTILQDLISCAIFLAS